MIVSLANKSRRRAVFAALLLIILAVLIGTNAAIPGDWDENIRYFMTQIQTDYGDGLMAAATFLGSPVMNMLYLVILSIVLFLADLKIPALWVFVTTFAGQAVNQIVKALVHRERPIGHLLSDSGASFPSQHSFATWLMIFIMLLLVAPNIRNAVTRILVRWLLITLGFLVMLSRVYLSAHFTSDVLAGLLLAYVWYVFAASLYAPVALFLKNKFWRLKDQEI
ncbi:phosphatase PAP2 family protein [Leuconostocaceae bacterium ESL0958]|nr:phosphatase PAP2 family protein [Leuconostocaceae bacterium ESL0958]